MPLAAGTKLDGYEIFALLGSGGMGEVYRARASALRREVAIKVLPTYVSGDPDRLRRFEQEAQAAAALNHPNILAVHRFGTHEGAPYLVAELLEGSTLREVLRHGCEEASLLASDDRARAQQLAFRAARTVLTFAVPVRNCRTAFGT